MEIVPSSILKSKSSKIDCLIFDIENEVAVTTKFLNYIKEHSIELMKNLNNIVSPSLYLQEFVKVNSVLLNFISLLTEINCKFEILHLTKTKNFENKTDVFHIFENLKQNNKTSKAFKEFENEDVIPKSESVNPNTTVLLCENYKYFSEPSSEFCKNEKCSKENPKIFSDVQSANVTLCHSSSLEYSIIPQNNSDINKDTSTCYNKVTDTELLNHNNEKIEEVTKLNVEDISLPVGTEHDVTVEYIQSPSEFYVNFFNKFHLFQELQLLLQEIPANIQEMQNKNNSITKNSLSKKFDSGVLYYSVCDESWFRAAVTNWNLDFDDDLVYIFLLDAGESKWIHVNFLQPMPNRLKKYPIFVKKCHLYNLLPINMKENDNSPNWMRGTCEKMKYWIESSKKIKVKIAPRDQFLSTSSIPVMLWLVDNNKCVNELLLNLNLAKQYVKKELVADSSVNNNTTSNTENILMENWNPMKEDFESYKNNYDLDLKNPATIIYGYVGNDYKRVCRQFAKKGFCYKGKFCLQDHQILNHLGYTTDGEKVFKNAYNSFPPPALGEVYNIEVTCVVEINKFYCVKEDENQTLEETLSTLMPFMNSSQNVLEMKKLAIPPAVGQVVIAKYSEDSLWYRAKILESEPESDLYTVIFVDFGNKEQKSLSCIREIEPRYLHLPFQAIKCSINGIAPNPNSSQEDAIEYLTKKVDGKYSKIKVISIFPGDDLSLLVDLYDDKGDDVGQDLIAKNYGLPKNEIIIKNNSEVLPG